MERTFDINSTADRIFLQQWLRSNNEVEWQNYLDFCYSEEHKNNFSYEERENLGIVKNFLQITYDLTFNQLKAVSWSYSIIERINKLKLIREQNQIALNEEKMNIPLKHFTLRVAWHDNMWNGCVCREPEKNIYCNGYHSLLSDRIRREKERLLSLEKKYAGRSVLEMYKDEEQKGEIPPCYWCINLFGLEKIPIKHINPAARTVLNPISDNLPPNSMFSWPFGISFVRNYQDYLTNGKYWGNFDNVRVPRFRSKIKRGKSLGFIYAKFSNPLSYEDFKYLIIGCGLISDIGDKQYFGPETELNKIRNHPYKKQLRNFPKTNWAIKYVFDPATLVRIPYHEYIAEAERRGLNNELSEKMLENIKITVDEPELEHCFKFVNMDIDDDEAIFLLSKIKNKLIESLNDGIVRKKILDDYIKKTDNLIEYCWNRRTHFPGLANLSRALLDINENDSSVLDDFVETVKSKKLNYSDVIKQLMINPRSDEDFRKYRGKLNELKEILDIKEISIDQFLKLSMLNLSFRQFNKIITGGACKNRELKVICNNPYILFEEYEADKEVQDNSTGDFVDFPIELFKIDIALFPNQDYLEKIELQEEYKITDKRRIRALIIQYLNSLEFYSGDCFDDAVSIQKYIEESPLFYKSSDASLKLPELFLEKRDLEYESHLAEKLEIVQANNHKYYYLNRVYNAEQKINDFIQILISSNEVNELKYEDIENYLKKSVSDLKKKIGNNFNTEDFIRERRFLYENIFQKRFYLLIGNPGSGKSYEILNIIKYLVSKGESYILLAPTGKAVLRLKSDENFKNAGINAMTIDKFISEMEKNKIRRTKYNNVILDEMSMVDLIKFKTLLKYFKAEDPFLHRLILAGDLNQLPPIGFGKPFYDIINYIKSNKQYSNFISELEVNCRQEMEENEILNFSKFFTNETELNSKQIEEIEKGGQISNGFKINYWENEYQLEEMIKQELDLLCIELNIKCDEGKKLDFVYQLDENDDNQFNPERFQVITPYRSYSDNINNYFQEKIKSDSEINILNLFKDHDKIIRVKNFYQKDELILSNGSIGIAFENDDEGKLYFQELNDKFIDIGGENGIYEKEKEYFELAYCITVHKSQGSGFEHLFVVLPKKFGILCKELFYTALTRSKKSITIFVEGKSGESFDLSLFEYARKRTYTEKRKTSLMLKAPHLYYGLEPEPNVFVQSRVEQMIYMILKEYRNKYKDSHGFDFVYEKYPEVNGKIIRIKTDFTIFVQNNVYYWEHLGLLNKTHYKKQWLEIKLPEYRANNLLNNLITTDELYGISDEKIHVIINDILQDKLNNEDIYKKYSEHHYSLR